MMKILGIAMVAVGMAALPACTGPIQANQDPNMPSQVTVDSYWLQAEVYATVMPPTRVAGSGQLQVPIELRNKTDHDLSLDYQGTFVDKNGAQTDNAPAWMHVMVPKRGTAQITLTSLSANAADFRVHIRAAK